MKPIGITFALAFGVCAWPALSQAQCTNGTRLNQGQLNALLASNALVCGRPGPAYPGEPSDRWQEEHRVGGELWDYKLGPGHPIDPRKKVGQWSIAGTGANATVTHTYGSTSYTWSVHGPNTNTPSTSVYDFCSGGSVFARAYVLNSSSGCGGSYPP